jgi:tRNA/tmRNA/rRNA uracil-C5-methylase (TrmA/RlmC/RlmD family)
VLEPEQLSGPPELQYTVAGRRFAIRPSGFWQTHPRAAEVLTDAVLRAVDPQPGERALELYAGSGMFTAALAGAVTGTGKVLGLEADRGAVADAQANLANLAYSARAGVRCAPVDARSIAAAAQELGTHDTGSPGTASSEKGSPDSGSSDGLLDVVVLDPPRTGAGREVIAAILACAPRVVVYVACDPAALARDIRFAMDAGWRLDELSAFDAFPMTHHVECVAVLRPGRPDGAGSAGTTGETESDAVRPYEGGHQNSTVQVG